MHQIIAILTAKIKMKMAELLNYCKNSNNFKPQIYVIHGIVQNIFIDTSLYPVYLVIYIFTDYPHHQFWVYARCKFGTCRWKSSYKGQKMSKSASNWAPRRGSNDKSPLACVHTRPDVSHRFHASTCAHLHGAVCEKYISV